MAYRRRMVFWIYEDPLEPDHLIRFMHRAWNIFSPAR